MVKSNYVIIGCFVFWVTTSIALAQDPNLVGQWTFEQIPSRTIRDSSGHAFNGLLQGDADWALGMTGIALALHGQGYALFDDPPPLEISHALTISALIKPQDMSLRSGLLTKGTTGSPWAWQLTPEGHLRFLVNWRLDGQTGGIWQSAGTIDPNEWTHVAVTFSGTEVCFYIDGQPERITLNQPLILGQTEEAMTLGADLPGSNDFFVGLIEFMRLYNRVLDAAEIQAQCPMRSQAYHPHPANGATQVLSPWLAWDAGDQAAAHRLWLGTDPNQLVEVAELPAEQTTWLSTLGWIPGEHYYWHVDEVQADANLVEGPLWDFMTLPLQASDPIPADGAQYVLPTTSLKWEPGATSIYQQVYLATDPCVIELADESWPQYLGTFLWFENALNVAGLDTGTTYYWRIDEVEFDGILWPGDIWHFTTLKEPEGVDDSLSLWWALDEGQGGVATDSSGQGHHGTIESGQWTGGRAGDALVFDSEQTQIQASDVGLPSSSEPLGLSLWIYPLSQQDKAIMAWGEDNPSGPQILALKENQWVYTYAQQEKRVEIGPVTGQWSHLVVNRDAQGVVNMFINNVPLKVNSQTLSHTVSAPNQPGIFMGRWPRVREDQYFDGMMDDIRVYDEPLDAAMIESLQAVNPYVAHDPVPGDRTRVSTEQAQILTWTAGSHPDGLDFDVYLGQDYDRVSRATVDDQEVYLGRTADVNWPLGLSLEPGLPYYWRIDQRLRDDTLIHGDIWRFCVYRGLLIDDFETYSNDDHIYVTWRDGYGFGDTPGNGTSSIVGHDDPPYVETEVVYSGGQSMPLRYYNANNPYYSEVTRHYDNPQNWDISGATALLLYLAGEESNIPWGTDEIYLRLEDDTGMEIKMVYEDSEMAIESRQWREWAINLDTLRQAGLDLQAIVSIGIGVGKPDDPQSGYNGILYIDDIQIGVP